MKVFSVEDNDRLVKLKVETEDDLWVVYDLLMKGDVVYARTTRELKTGSGSKRKGMVLGVKVEWAEFQPFTSRLRVHGTIVSGPKELDLIGQRHTLNIDPGQEMNIFREWRWNERELRKLQKASERSSSKAVVVGIDWDEWCIAYLRDYGVEKLAESHLSIPGKGSPERREDAIKNEISKIAKKVEESLKNRRADVLIIAGPSYLKEMLKEKLRLQGVKVYLEDTSYGGIKGVYEALKRGVVQRILRDYGIVEEERLMEEFMYLLAKEPEKVAYGLDPVERASEVGAVEKLLVTTEMMRSPDIEVRRRVDKVMSECAKKGAHIKIFNSMHSTHLWLKHMGGVAAVLRYGLGL